MGNTDFNNLYLIRRISSAMIGRKRWFEPKSDGPGLYPTCWQGWVYILIFVAVLLLLIIIPEFWFFNDEIRGPIIFGWIILFIVDAVIIWATLEIKGK